MPRAHPPSGGAPRSDGSPPMAAPPLPPPLPVRTAPPRVGRLSRRVRATSWPRSRASCSPWSSAASGWPSGCRCARTRPTSPRPPSPRHVPTPRSRVQASAPPPATTVTAPRRLRSARAQGGPRGLVPPPATIDVSDLPTAKPAWPSAPAAPAAAAPARPSATATAPGAPGESVLRYARRSMSPRFLPLSPALACALGLAVSTGVAPRSPPPTTPAPPPTHARSQYNAGTKAFADQRFVEAALNFEAAADEKPSPVALYTAALSWEQANVPERAADDYARSLALAAASRPTRPARRRTGSSPLEGFARRGHRRAAPDGDARAARREHRAARAGDAARLGRASTRSARALRASRIERRSVVLERGKTTKLDLGDRAAPRRQLPTRRTSLRRRHPPPPPATVRTARPWRLATRRRLRGDGRRAARRSCRASSSASRPIGARDAYRGGADAARRTTTRRSCRCGPNVAFIAGGVLAAGGVALIVWPSPHPAGRAGAQAEGVSLLPAPGGLLCGGRSRCAARLAIASLAAAASRAAGLAALRLLAGLDQVPHRQAAPVDRRRRPRRRRRRPPGDGGAGRPRHPPATALRDAPITATPAACNTDSDCKAAAAAGGACVTAAKCDPTWHVCLLDVRGNVGHCKAAVCIRAQTCSVPTTTASRRRSSPSRPAASAARRHVRHRRRCGRSSSSSRQRRRRLQRRRPDQLGAAGRRRARPALHSHRDDRRRAARLLRQRARRAPGRPTARPSRGSTCPQDPFVTELQATLGVRGVDLGHRGAS